MSETTMEKVESIEAENTASTTDSTDVVNDRQARFKALQARAVSRYLCIPSRCADIKSRKSQPKRT
jgi:hypothetical protein